jgi:acyl-CoA thioester hydrolase
MHHQLIRVYYEDTDAGGVVYYANYLKFAERARTEWLRDLGVDQHQLRQESGIFFVVKRCEVDYMAPAFLDDELRVQTCLQELGNASISMKQTVKRLSDEQVLAELQVVVVSVNEQLRPNRIPAKLRDTLSA